MQSLAQNGYTHDEVLNAILGTSGTRTWSFRYDVVSSNRHQYLRELTDVVSCKISQNSLADIKRTARLEIKDNGQIDFLNERIKPWAQLQMYRYETTYNDLVEALQYKVARFPLDGDGSNLWGYPASPVNPANVSYQTPSIIPVTSRNLYTVSNGYLEHTAVVGEPLLQGRPAFTVMGFCEVVGGNEPITTTADAGSLYLGFRLRLQSTATDRGTGTRANAVRVEFPLTDGPVVVAETDSNAWAPGLVHYAVTWFLGSPPKIYINGVEKSVIYTENPTYNSVDGGVDNATKFRITGAGVEHAEVVVLPNPLAAASILEIHQAALMNGPYGIKNYAEWAQGVFIPSTPTRTNNGSSSNYRSIDCYDLNLAWLDDKVGGRYSVDAGTKYVDALRYLLGYTYRANWSTIDTTYWNGNVGTVAAHGDYASVSFPGTANSSSMLRQFGVGLGGTSVAVRVVPNSAAGLETALDIAHDNPAYGFTISYLSGTMTFRAKTNGVISQATTPYNSTNHAHWRIREISNIVYFETSPDGETWTIQYSTPYDWTDVLGSQNYQLRTTTTSSSGAGMSSNFYEYTTISAGIYNLNYIESSSLTLPVTMEWEPGTSKLAIMNNLLSAMNYGSLYFDHDGVAQGRPYVSPASRASEWTYDVNSNSMILPGTDQTIDLFSVPNKWILVVSEPERPPLIGTYTNTSASSPTSTVNRQRTITDFRTEIEAADQATLNAKTARLAFEASQVYEIVEFETAIMPIHGHADVYTLRYPDLGLTAGSLGVKFSEQTWELEMRPGSAMTHRIRRVVTI